MVLSTTSSIEGCLRTDQSDRRLMLFDLSIRGHHPNYIKQLILYWGQHQLPGTLHIVVSPRFLQEHSDVVAIARDADQNVHFIAITESEEAALKSRKSPLTRQLRSLREWNLACQYAAQLQATAVVLMYFDPFQLPLALGLRSPCPVSGLYFRPTFHYGKFGVRPLSWRERLQQWREILLIKRVLQHPNWQTLSCIDPLVIEHLDRTSDSPQWSIYPILLDITPLILSGYRDCASNSTLRAIGEFFRCLGHLPPAKEFCNSMDAAAILPPNQARKLCVLLVEESNFRSKLEQRE